MYLLLSRYQTHGLHPQLGQATVNIDLRLFKHTTKSAPSPKNGTVNTLQLQACPHDLTTLALTPHPCIDSFSKPSHSPNTSTLINPSHRLLHPLPHQRCLKLLTHSHRSPHSIMLHESYTHHIDSSILCHIGVAALI